MPIHDQGYRRYQGGRAALGKSWQVMTRAGVMTMVAKRVFIGVMLMAWVAVRCSRRSDLCLGDVHAGGVSRAER